MPDHQDHPAIIREASRSSTGTFVTESSPIVCIKMKADHKNQLRGLSGGHHPTTMTDKVIEKPPPGPVKRKKKLDRSLVDLSCSPKMEQKRQKITTDAEVDTTAAASAAVDVQHQATNPPPKELAQSARGSKAKELQNHTLFKWRRKNEETNAALVQKLNAYTEQLRLEINDLKTALISEKNAVRALRAQQEAVTRKLKMEVKQTKEAKEHQQQLQNSHQTKKVLAGSKCGSETEPNYTVQCSKLQHEIAVLKEQNKILEGKIQSSADADKKKVSDVRGLKEAYDLRLTQVTKSAKLEIRRLLEEIKAKDKAIQILKKDLLTAKDSPKKPPNMRKETPKTASPIAKPAPTNLLVDSVKQLSSQAGEQNENADPQKPVKGNEIEMMNAINLRSELEFVQTENDILKSELNSAQEEIKSLKATLAITKDDEKSIYERIRVLEFKESELLKEAHELREQNDLLEFRIVELEESHDKWSLRSHPATTMTPSTSTSPHSSTSTQQHTRDALWTDPEKEADDMMMMMSERSDSGVTSPHSNHQSEDRLSMPSPCDLAMIDSDNDDIRKRILSMTKRSCYDEEDKIALMQILSLLNNLEALSQDHEISGEFSSLDSATINNVAAMGKSDGTKINGHLVPVATVQPFTDASSPMDEEPIMPQLKNSLRMTGSASGKVMLWNSLQESGVFEEQMVVNQATQTHTDEFPLPERPGDLTTEIQKLYKFRERIEEVVGSSKKGSNSLLSPDQRKLEYYKERAEALERKLTIYESSDDVQLRKLGERLQREIQLEALSKRMEQTIAELEKTNQVLEEERCEFEEAENDTRLKFQRLEVDFELMTQRNVELEMGEEALQAKLQEAKKQLAIYEERVQQMERRLEELECLKRSCSTPTESLASSAETELRQQVGEMLKREQAMQQNLDELKRAYNETLENADNVWAEMENEYKCKLKECEVNEQGLQSKLQQLEERIKHDSQFAQERLMQMEEVEANLKLRIGALNRENKDLVAKYSSLLDEFNALKEEYQKLKIYLTGPAAELLERERRKVGSLEEELKHSNEMLVQLEARSKDNILGLKLKMTAAIKELENIRITNNELQEEVVTLEARVVDAKRMQTVDEETIRHLTEELRVKQKQLNNYQTSAYRSTQPNLAQELSQVNSFPALPAFMKPKVAVAEPVVFPKGVKRVAETVLEQNGKPKLLPKPEDIPRLIIRAKDP